MDVLNKLITFESSIGKIKYVGPVYELKDDKGWKTLVK
jgi:hypothetical protein